MTDKTPLKLVDLGSGQGAIKEFELGDTVPGSYVSAVLPDASTGSVQDALDVFTRLLDASNPGYGAAMLGRGAQVVPNVTGMRALLKTSASSFATMLGVTNPGDGGRSDYWLDFADTTSVDNVPTLIVATDGGRWKRLSGGRNTNKMYVEQGGRVDRFGDRVFMGDATKHAGTNVAAQGDWLTTWLMGKGRAFAFQQVSQGAILTSSDPASSNAFLAGARTSNVVGAGNGIALLGVGVNDNTLYATSVYGGYFEGFNDVGSLGSAQGVELDSINFNVQAVSDPFFQHSKQVIALQIASGGEFSPVGQFPSSAAINIRNNGSAYDRGIIFGNDAVSGANGVTGTGIAIAFARGHMMQWYSGTGAPSGGVLCDSSSTAAGILQTLSDNQVNWKNVAGNPIFQVFAPTNSVNFLSVRPDVAGSAVQLTAQGTDTNVDLRLAPKGAGLVWLGPYTGGVPAATGYISVKATSGSTFKVLVGV